MIGETFRLDRGLVELFADASGDRNPLHLSDEYARRTSYGEPVVFGMLGVLACLGALPPRAGSTLARLVVDFPSPMFTSVDYVARVDGGNTDAPKVRLYDGRRVVAKLSARFRAGQPPSPRWEARPLSLAALVRTDAELAPGVAFSGPYAPEPAAIDRLVDRWALAERGIGPLHVLALAGASYLVGMEMPGERALFARAEVDFSDEPAQPVIAPRYSGRVAAFDERFAMVDLEVDLRDASSERPPLARALLRAFARRGVPPLDETQLERSDDLRGKVAIVIGASRGLGAALSHALARRGCTVVGSYARSAEHARELAARIAADGGRFEPLLADASTGAGCAHLRRHVQEKHGRLDFLVCNAAPAPRPLWLEPASVDRIVDYVARSVALACAPLAHLVDLVDASGGTAAIVSSVFVTDPPAEWPQYVAAKAAVEGLARVAAREYPRARVVIARPGRILTDMSNAPVLTAEFDSLERVAGRIVSSLVAADSPAAGDVDLVSFP